MVPLVALDLSAQDFGASHGYGTLKKKMMKGFPQQQFGVRKDGELFVRSMLWSTR